MNDAEKLNLLADWFDKEQESGRWKSYSCEVQRDLRDLARRISAIGGNVPQPDNTADHKRWICDKCQYLWTEALLKVYNEMS